MNSDNPASAGDGNYLPNFCASRVLFLAVIGAELLAMVVTLAGFDPRGFWQDLAMASLLIQWVLLGSTALLCRLRGRLNRLGDGWSSAAVMAIILLVCGALSAAIFRIPGLYPARIGASVFVLRNLAITVIVTALALRYLYIQHHAQRHLRAEAQARIQALQSRIRPHFLFNSMNTIASLTRSAPATAEKVVLDLSELFRVSLRDASELSTLADELALCRRYIDIEKLRLGERLHMLWEVGDYPAAQRVPGLLLQPLLENAVYHGVEPAADGGTVRLQLSSDAHAVHITISNDLPARADDRHRPGNQMALSNVDERLRAVFGPAARLDAGAQDGEYRVSLSLPR